MVWYYTFSVLWCPKLLPTFLVSGQIKPSQDQKFSSILVLHCVFQHLSVGMYPALLSLVSGDHLKGGGSR